MVWGSGALGSPSGLREADGILPVSRTWETQEVRGFDRVTLDYTYIYICIYM